MKFRWNLGEIQVKYPTDECIGRNILKLESQSEYNNPKHWTAIYVLPIQRWEVTSFLSTWITSSIFEEANGLIVEPAHTRNFNVFCNGVESVTVCSLHFDSLNFDANVPAAACFKFSAEQRRPGRLKQRKIKTKFRKN